MFYISVTHPPKVSPSLPLPSRVCSLDRVSTGQRPRGICRSQSSPWGRGENRWPFDTQKGTITVY